MKGICEGYIMSEIRPIFEYELEEFDILDEERKNEILEIRRLNEIIRDEIRILDNIRRERLYKIYEERKKNIFETEEVDGQHEAGEIFDIEIHCRKKVIVSETKNYISDVKAGICGAYILNFTDGKRYVGSSTDLKNRLYGHKSTALNLGRNIEYLVLYFTMDILDALILEHYLIKKFKPELNSDFDRIKWSRYI